MNAKQQLRLRLAAADFLVRASDAADAAERHRLRRLAEKIMKWADGVEPLPDDAHELSSIEEMARAE
jgi:hypothetical protein